MKDFLSESDDCLNDDGLLEKLLRDKFSNTLLSDDNVQRIMQGEYHRDNILSALNWCRDVIVDYVDAYGALSKGEFNAKGGQFLKSHAWRLNQYVVDRKIRKEHKNENITLNGLLSEKGIQHKQLFALLHELENHDITNYKAIVDTNGTVWFKDINRAIKYVDEVIIRQRTQRSSPRLDCHSTPYSRVSHDNESSHDPSEEDHHKLYEEPNTIENITEFAMRYGLDDGSIIAQSPVSKENVERMLFIGGLSDRDDLRSMVRIIIRNPKFADVLKINKHKEYSLEKLKTLAKFYANAIPIDRDRFWSDVNTAFGS